MEPLENAEAVEMNEESIYEDSESFLADMENMEGVVEDNEESYDENEYVAAEDRYGGQDYPSDMIDTDSSDDEEMTIKDYERMMKSVW